MAEKFSNDISSESTHHIHSQNINNTSIKGLKVAQSCSKNYEISDFGLLEMFSSALCYCTAELLSSHGRPSSVKPIFSENVKQINAKFGGKDHISRQLFCFSKYRIFFIFYDFFFVFVNMGPYRRKSFKRHLL